MRRIDDGTCSRDTYIDWLAEVCEHRRRIDNALQILVSAAINRKPQAVRHACAEADAALDWLVETVHEMED
jgi:hypothetical protein